MPIAFEGRVGEYEKVDFAVLRTKLGRGFTGWVAERGEPLLIADANADPRGSTIPGTDDVDESMLVVPMRYDERIVGTITLSKLGLHQFDDEDLRLLTILADQAATALESVRLLARSQALAAELQRLLDMSSDLANSLEPRTVADLIAPYPSDALRIHPISTRVNAVKNDDPALLEPVEQAHTDEGPEPVPDEMLTVMEFAPKGSMRGTPHLPGTREFFTCLRGRVTIFVATFITWSSSRNATSVSSSLPRRST